MIERHGTRVELAREMDRLTWSWMDGRMPELRQALLDHTRARAAAYGWGDVVSGVVDIEWRRTAGGMGVLVWAVVVDGPGPHEVGLA